MEAEKHLWKETDLREGEKSAPFGRIGTTKQIVHTLVVYYCNLCFGITMAFIAPALIEFTKRLDTDMKTMSIIMTVAGAIGLVTSFAFGWLFGRGNRHIIATVLFVIMSATLFAIPYTKSIPVFATLFTMLTIAGGGWGTAQAVWVIDLWKEKADPWVQGQHFFFALGSIIPPTLFAPFLEDNKKIATNETVVENGTSKLATESSRVTIPTFICAGIVSVGGLLLLLSFLAFRKPQKTVAVKSTEEDVALKSDAPSGNGIKKVKEMTKSTKTVVTVLSAIFAGTFMCMEVTVNQFLPAYAHYSNFGLSEADGARVLSVFSIAFTIARLAGVAISMKLDSKLILCGNIAIVTIANIVLWVASGYGAKEYIWVGSALLGVGISTTMPTIFVFVSSHLEMTSMVGSIMLNGGSVLATLCPIIIGWYIESVANVVVYLNIAAVVIGTVTFVAILLLVRRKD